MLAVLVALIAFCGCRDWIYEGLDCPADGDGTTLHLRVNTVNGRTRGLLSESFETIHTLRIILLDDEGKVEVNRYFGDTSNYDFVTPTGNNDFVITQLKPGAKTIYVFANEDGAHGIRFTRNGTEQTARCLGDLLDQAEKGVAGFGDVLESVWFDGFYPQQGNLPFTAKYDLTLGKGSENYQTLYIVPAAVKFSFYFYNYRQDPVKVNNIKIASMADRSYMLGNVGPADYLKSYPGQSDKLYWIDWLNKVAIGSWTTDGDVPANETYNETYGWITDYYLPSATIHAPMIIDGFPIIASIPDGSATPSAVDLAYLPESKNLSGASQKYALIFDIEGAAEVNGIPYEIENLKALFRDTHVKVYITFKDGKFDIDTKVDVDPWDEDELNPEFGGGNNGTTDDDPWDEDEQNPEVGIHVWSGNTDVDPWDENELNPDLGHNHGGFSDNDPWDEDEENPNFGSGSNGSNDNDPWDEDEQNPESGGGNNGSNDNDPWDEDEQNPEAGGGNNGSNDNDPWDEDEQNPEFGSGNNGSNDNDPWDEDEENPEAGGNGNNASGDSDPWDETEMNPSFGK